MIKAKVVCDSVSPEGKRLTTFELEYPRIIHSEFMTHRMLSRNAASSRAIPFEKMLKQLEGKPVRFGAANKGMQDKGEDFHEPLIGDECGEVFAPEGWEMAKQAAIEHASLFYEAGYHKQVYNRLLEPFSMIKAVISATEWNNFFWLRNDSAADPTIQAVAQAMQEAMDTSDPVLLHMGEWHLPYVDFFRNDDGSAMYRINNTDGNFGFVSESDAIKVSAARCAAISFRNNDYGLEKCLEVYDRLVGDERKHSSALEHQATPMRRGVDFRSKGVTHKDRNGDFWSGNYAGWVQHRQLIPGHNKEG